MLKQWCFNDNLYIYIYICMCKNMFIYVYTVFIVYVCIVCMFVWVFNVSIEFQVSWCVKINSCGDLRVFSNSAASLWWHRALQHFCATKRPQSMATLWLRRSKAETRPFFPKRPLVKHLALAKWPITGWLNNHVGDDCLQTTLTTCFKNICVLSVFIAQGFISSERRHKSYNIR